MATVCHMYGWTHEYVMSMPTRRVMMYYRRGLELLTGKDPMPPDTPDRERFYEVYGKDIRTE